MTDHQIEVSCVQDGTLVMRHDYVEFRVDSQDLDAPFQCSCGEAFSNKEAATNHLQNNA